MIFLSIRDTIKTVVNFLNPTRRNSMTQRENSVVSETPTSIAITHLKAYLHSLGHTDSTIYVKDDMIYVEFPKKVTFSEDSLNKVRELFYWTDTLSVPYITGLVHFYEYSDTLLISVKFYDKISSVHDYLNAKGFKLLEFDVCNYEFTFKFSTSDTNEFNEDILNEIKKIVDPEDIFRRAVGLFEVSEDCNCHILSMKG